MKSPLPNGETGKSKMIQPISQKYMEYFLIDHPERLGGIYLILEIANQAIPALTYPN